MERKILRKRDSILYSWFVSYVLVLLVPILIGTYLYNSAYSVIKRTTREVFEASLDQSALQTDNQLRENSAILGQLLGDEDVQRLSSVKGGMDTNAQLILISLTGRLQKLVMNHPDIEDIYVLFGESGSVVSTKGHMSGELFSELYLDDDRGRERFNELFEELSGTKEVVNIHGKGGKEKLLFHKRTLDTGLGHSSAIIVIQMDEDSFMGGLYESDDTPFVILDKDGNTVAATRSYEKIADSDKRYESISTLSSESSWKYIYMISTGIYEATARNIQIKTILGLVICMALGLYISVRMSRKNYNPIKHLLEITNTLPSKEPVKGNEFDLLKERVNSLYDENRTRDHELYTHIRELKNLQVFSLISGNVLSTASGSEINGDAIAISTEGNAVVLFRNPYLNEKGEFAPEDEKNYELLQSVIVNIFEEIAGEHFGVASTTSGLSVASVISLLPEKEMLKENFTEILQADIRKMQETIDEYLHLWVIAAVGGVYEEPEGIHMSYLEARETMKVTYAFSLQKGETSGNAKFCEEIKEYIQENYSDPDLNISQAAIHFGITPSYLSGIFKKETGMSLLGYISEVRTEKAKDLLAGEITIAEVAKRAGFRDSAALIRTFKKNVGMTPGQYRETAGFQDFENSF